MQKMFIRGCTIVMRRALATCTIGVDNIERFKIIAASWRVRATEEYNTATYNDEWADSHDTMQVLARRVGDFRSNVNRFVCCNNENNQLRLINNSKLYSRL
ncbi:hypothetical protein DPMN_130964 [Dreissena polymorpha]|uniref:Uncharacterized protein n=1 Tax=Dreissena polymorpha TaxID=45954 RepID=A0A9D4H3S3_DREPO|nr:hypothetical protein DPMN_130964 [Dreissena polymorpha]